MARAVEEFVEQPVRRAAMQPFAAIGVEAGGDASRPHRLGDPGIAAEMPGFVEIPVGRVAERLAAFDVIVQDGGGIAFVHVLACGRIRRQIPVRIEDRPAVCGGTWQAQHIGEDESACQHPILPSEPGSGFGQGCSPFRSRHARNNAGGRRYNGEADNTTDDAGGGWTPWVSLAAMAVGLAVFCGLVIRICVSSYIPLVRGFSEVIDDGWLMGEFRDFVLLADSALASVWREIAPNQPIDLLDRIDVPEKCIIFDVGKAAVQLRERLQRERPPGTALSFLTEYYPSVCAKTFAAGRMADEPGPGVIMFQTPRTGSHLMQGMIANLGEFGAPDEWIRPPVMEAVRLGALGLVDHLVRCARHQRAFHQVLVGLDCLAVPF